MPSCEEGTCGHDHHVPDMDVEATKKMRQPSRVYYCHGSFGNYMTATRPKDDKVLQVFEEVEDDGN